MHPPPTLLWSQDDYRLHRYLTLGQYGNDLHLLRAPHIVDLWRQRLRYTVPDTPLEFIDPSCPYHTVLSHGETPLFQISAGRNGHLKVHTKTQAPISLQDPHFKGVCSALAHLLRTNRAGITAISGLPTPTPGTALLTDATLVPTADAPPECVLAGHLACISPPQPRELLDCPFVTVDLSEAPDDIFNHLPLNMLASFLLGRGRSYTTSFTRFLGGIEAMEESSINLPTLRGLLHLILCGKAYVFLPLIRFLDHLQSTDSDNGSGMAAGDIAQAFTVILEGKYLSLPDLLTVGWLQLATTDADLPLLRFADTIVIDDAKTLSFPNLIKTTEIQAPDADTLFAPSLSSLERLIAPNLKTIYAPKAAIPHHLHPITHDSPDAALSALFAETAGDRQPETPADTST